MDEYYEEPQEEDMKPCMANLKQLAGFYKIDVKTMRRYIMKHAKYIGKRFGYYFSKHQVKRIFAKLGPPSIKKILKIRKPGK